MQFPFANRFTPFQETDGADSYRVPDRRRVLKLGATSLLMPIPWLDKNGNHNQPAGPNVELSNIYHFKRKLARCSGFHGMGTDNKGNRLAWGTPTTDYSYMLGEYWAARQARQGIFAHT